MFARIRSLLRDLVIVGSSSAMTVLALIALASPVIVVAMVLLTGYFGGVAPLREPPPCEQYMLRSGGTETEVSPSIYAVIYIMQIAAIIAILDAIVVVALAALLRRRRRHAFAGGRE